MQYFDILQIPQKQLTTTRHVVLEPIQILQAHPFIKTWLES